MTKLEHITRADAFLESADNSVLRAIEEMVGAQERDIYFEMQTKIRTIIAEYRMRLKREFKVNTENQ